VTDSIPRERLLKPVGFEGQYDPHVWFDVELWSSCVGAVLEELVSLRGEDRAYFEANATVARKTFADLHAWALAKSAELPPAKRVLVTSHDAYNYFGRAYGFKVVALQGIKAIFVESSVPHNTIERISRDAGVRVGGELFSDAMGNRGQMENGVDVGTYEGMIRHNLTTLVEALK
jgi:manganese/zinc/iron transport system substrate-binding protein